MIPVGIFLFAAAVAALSAGVCVVMAFADSETGGPRSPSPSRANHVVTTIGGMSFVVFAAAAVVLLLCGSGILVMGAILYLERGA